MRSEEVAASGGVVPPPTRKRGLSRLPRRARVSAWLLIVLFALSLCAELVANDRPLIVWYKGQVLLPIVTRYTEKDTFGGVLESEADYHDPFVRGEIAAHGWMVETLVPFDYRSVHFAVPRAPTAPTAANLLGTDDQARDVLARVIYGIRLSMLFALLLAAASSIIGIGIGAVCGYFGGWLDLVLQRFIEIWEGIPVLFLLIILSAMIVPSFWSLLVLMLLFRWMSLVDVVRAEFFRVRNFDYVRAARALGVPEMTILRRHVLPNAMVPVVTFLPFLVTGALTTLTSLDFLGFGLPAGSPSLGELLAQGKNNPQSPWLGLTGFFVLALMLSLWLFIGEGIRDACDPRKR